MSSNQDEEQSSAEPLTSVRDPLTLDTPAPLLQDIAGASAAEQTQEQLQVDSNVGDDIGNVVEAEPVGTLSGTAEVMHRARLLWRDREPEDTSDAVPHLSWGCLTAPGGTRLVAASRRGLSHAHDAVYREDAYAFRLTDKWLLFAIADGAGSKPLARVGARLASDAAVAFLEQELGDQADEDISKRLHAVLAGALANAVTAVVVEAARRQRDPDDFASTLLVVAYRLASDDPLVGVAQVGDGGVAAQRQTGECLPLTVADRGSFAGESYFLTSPETQLTWGKRAQVLRVTEPFDALLAATDGVWDDFTPPYGSLDTLFSQLSPILGAAESEPDKKLLDWLAYERRASFDDRTIVALLPGRVTPST